jgi:transcriptional regulator with XRE-family HTH domain
MTCSQRDTRRPAGDGPRHPPAGGRARSLRPQAELDEALKRVTETYGGNRREAGNRYEQELARAFHRSGWKQEDLAKKVGKSQSSIEQSLRFGRFLDFTATAVNQESVYSSLSENAFRTYWRQTDKREGNAALINMASNLVLMRRILEETSSRSWQIIWEENKQLYYPSARTVEPNSPKPTISAPSASEKSKTPESKPVSKVDGRSKRSALLQLHPAAYAATLATRQ